MDGTYKVPFAGSKHSTKVYLMTMIGRQNAAADGL